MVSFLVCFFLLLLMTVGSSWKLTKGPHSCQIRVRNQLKNNFVHSISLATMSSFASILAAPKVTTAYGVVEEPRTKKKNKLKVGETELGIKYIDLKVGDGPNPYDGDLIAINYIGFKMDGTEFDSQYSKKNLAFKYGARQVIPGFEDVLATMRPGGQRSCTIPSKLAYGSKGVCIKDGCIVDPNEDLKFVITLKTIGAGYN